MVIHRIILSANTVSMWCHFCEYDRTLLFMMWFTGDSANPSQVSNHIALLADSNKKLNFKGWIP